MIHAIIQHSIKIKISKAAAVDTTFAKLVIDKPGCMSVVSRIGAAPFSPDAVPCVLYLYGDCLQKTLYYVLFAPLPTSQIITS